MVNINGGTLANHNDGKRPFRFDADWVLDTDYEDLIQSYWESMTESLPTKVLELRNKLFDRNIVTRRKRKFQKKGLVARMSFLEEFKPTDDILAELMEI